MKPIDIIILVAAIVFVGYMMFRKVKQYQENKKNGVIGCGSSCSGCTQVEQCEEIHKLMETIQIDKKKKHSTS